MQGSGITQPVKFLISEMRLSVFSSQSPSEKSNIDNNIVLVLKSHKFCCVFFIFTSRFDFSELLLL